MYLNKLKWEKSLIKAVSIQRSVDTGKKFAIIISFKISINFTKNKASSANNKKIFHFHVFPKCETYTVFSLLG